MKRALLDGTVRVAVMRGDVVVHWKARETDGTELSPSITVERAVSPTDRRRAA